MDDQTLFLFWFLGMPTLIVALLLAYWGADWFVWHLEQFGAQFRHRLMAARVKAAERFKRQEDVEMFRRWLAGRTGADQASGQVDQVLVDAQRRSEIIRVLIQEEIPKTVMRCLETH